MSLRHQLVVLPLLGVALQGCLPRERPTTASRLATCRDVRLRERGASEMTYGRLVRLAGDSVTIMTGRGGSDFATRTVAVATLDDIEVAEPLSQREAFKGGMLRGAAVGAVLGGGLLAVRHDAAGGAVGLVVLSSWLGGVVAGQSTESPRPPMRWRPAAEACGIPTPNRSGAG